MTPTTAALAVLGALAAAVLGLLGAGALLPREHEAARRVRLRQPPAAVWARIRDHAAEPDWRPKLDRVERVGGGGPERWKEISGRSAMTFETVEAVEPVRLVRRIADEGLPFGGTWTIAVEADGEGCAVAVTEHGEVKHPLLRAISRYAIGRTRTIDGYLRALAASFGESAAPEPAEPAPRP